MLWSNALFGNWQRPVYIAFMYKTIGNGKCLLLEIKKAGSFGAGLYYAMGLLG